jgi:2,5-furandicarboxylate decarboxylase 1
MEALIRVTPRTWKTILQHRLGRCDDAPWYRYTLSDRDFAVEAPDPGLSISDPRHGV